MVVITALLVLCFVGILIGMLTDMCLFFKEVYKDVCKKNQRPEEGRILHAEADGVPQGKCGMDTGKLRA